MRSNLRKISVNSNISKSFEEWKVASPWLRILAQIIDQGLVTFVVISAMALWFPQRIGTPRWFVTLILVWIFVSILIQTLFIWLYKNSPGKRSLGLTLQSAQPGAHRLRLTQIVVRSFTWWLGLLTLGAGWSTILSRPDRRAWHDVAADTVVVATSYAPQYPTATQKKAGEAWLGFLSLFFTFFIMSLIFVEMRSLKRENGGFYNTFEQLSLLDQQSWLVVPGTKVTSPEAILLGDDAKLSRLLIQFSEARLLPLGSRYAFYKSKMEPLEDEICKRGSETLPQCQSARLMVELLTPDPEKENYPKALQGLKVLQNIESYPIMIDQIAFIEKEIRKSQSGSPQYLALKSAKANLYLKAGQLTEAQKTLQSDLKKISGNQSKVNKTFESTFLESACGVTALADCSLIKNQICYENKKFQEWDAGCRLEQPVLFTSRAQALGYWWHQIQLDKIKTHRFSEWESVLSLEPKLQDSFESPVELAMDFIINIQTQPKSILTRERRLSPENPLWGWVHKEALKELGSQWGYVIYPIERRILEKSSILGSKNHRSPASLSTLYEKIPVLTPQLTIER